MQRPFPENGLLWFLAWIVFLAVLAAVLAHPSQATPVMELHRPVACPETDPPVTRAVSLARCEDVLEARRVLTLAQLRDRWPGGDWTRVSWWVRVIDVHPREGTSTVEVSFACPGSTQVVGTFYTTAVALGYRGGLDLNRGDSLFIEGYLHRDTEGWGPSEIELSVEHPTIAQH